jgi:hypothetical protein
MPFASDVFDDLDEALTGAMGHRPLPEQAAASHAFTVW